MSFGLTATFVGHRKMYTKMRVYSSLMDSPPESSHPDKYQKTREIELFLYFTTFFCLLYWKKTREIQFHEISIVFFTEFS